MRGIVWLLLASGCELVFPLSDGAPVCPVEGYVPIDGLDSQYSFRSTPQKWGEAEFICRADQVAGSSLFTHLVVVGSANENTSLVASGALGTNPSWWLGLTDVAAENTFAWVTEEPLQPPYPLLNQNAPWLDQEPNNGGGSPSLPENCVDISDTGTFNDVFCDNPQPFICECDAFPSTVTD